MWGSCFSLGSRRSPPASASRLAASPSSHISHHILVITPQLITAPLLTPHLSHLSSHLTHHTTTHHSSTSHTSLITSLITSHSSHHNSSQLHFSHLTHHTSVAGAVHRASWRSCGACGRRLGRGWLSCGRRSTQSLLEELRRAWPPLGPRLAFMWLHRASAARVAAAWAAPGFRVAGAVHIASWRSCARGRRWLSSHLILSHLVSSHLILSHLSLPRSLRRRASHTELKA